MEALITMQYVELKNQLDRELNTAAQSFVRIGYLLRVARDTDALAGSGYSDVSEFARAEYGLDRSQVSRFIRINERFGAGLALQQQYEGFGSSKLAEMLMLPDNVAAELPAEASKSEIRALAADLAEDEKTTTDLEIAMEDHSNDSIWLQAFREYFRLRPEEYVMLAERMAEGYPTIAFMDVIAPSGIALKTIRLTGIGKVTVSFRGNRPASILETRTGNREEKEVGALAEEISALFSRVKELSARGAWAVLYNEPFPAEAEENITEPEIMPKPVEPDQEPKDASESSEQAQETEDRTGSVAPVQQEEPAANKPPKPAKKAKVVDIVKPKPAKEPESSGKPEKKAKVVDIVKPKPAKGLESSGKPEKAEGTAGAEEDLPADIVDKNDEELQKAKKLAQTPMTAEQAILGEIMRLYRILGESIEEQNWARARGSAGTLIEHIAQIEKEQRQKEEEEDKAQMKFEDFPEILPGSGDITEEQEEG